MSERYDAIVIGTGQAGPSLAARLANAGQQVAIVERKLFGGTCVNTGCIPTKTMVASAYAAHMAGRGAEFGFTIEGSASSVSAPVKIDMKRVKERKDALSAKSRTAIERWLKNLRNCTVYEGHARFESSTVIDVQGTKLTAPRIFINVGGRPRVPDMPGLDQLPYLTNSSMMQVDFLPRHLVIVGGSYIGLEFAQMFRRFGSEETKSQPGSNATAALPKSPAPTC
jgi:pyruvate/2-oxoglutarate dehydrogenase complex dihydrolipoamide dehydrogenase (E3) component